MSYNKRVAVKIRSVGSPLLWDGENWLKWWGLNGNWKDLRIGF
jgi:hypothetical protein